MFVAMEIVEGQPKTIVTKKGEMYHYSTTILSYQLYHV
jgi:hypothetical protein